MNFWDNPATIGLVVGLPSFFIAYLGLKRAFKADRVSEKLGMASGQSQSIAQAFEGLEKVIEGLNMYILILQADRKVDREDVRRLTEQRDTLQKELDRMYKKYGRE